MIEINQIYYFIDVSLMYFIDISADISAHLQKRLTDPWIKKLKYGKSFPLSQS